MNSRPNYALLKCLRLNGFRLDANDEQALMAMLALASGDMSADAFASRIRANLGASDD